MSRAFLLLHGKGDGPTNPDSFMMPVKKFLDNNDYGKTFFEEYSWGWNRRYDDTIENSLEDIYNDLKFLRKNYEKVYCIGHSLGANILLQFAKKYNQPEGIVIINPAGNVGNLAFLNYCSSSIKKAQELIANGQTDEEHIFSDINMGTEEKIKCKPIPYLDMIYYKGPNNMYLLKAEDYVEQPILLLSSTEDSTQRSFWKVWDEVGINKNSKRINIETESHAVEIEHLKQMIKWITQQEKQYEH